MSKSCLLSLLASGAFLAACADTAGTPASESSVFELPSPAGEGSGEPFLSTKGDTLLMSWLEPAGDGSHELRLAALAGGAWAEPRVVARSKTFFVNWADFPSVAVGPSGALWAHWLQRGAAGGYDYGVRVATSPDGGVTWSDPWIPHGDGTPTEHGFVSMFPTAGGMGLVWLDGRKFAPGPDGGPPTEEMTLRYRTASTDGAPGPEVLLDGRICDCCQTGAALADAGPVVVYRNRTRDEIRDVYITRRVDGAWTEGRPVHDDGWNIGGCPVNGPAAAARGSQVAVAWFTAANDVPRVKVAFSEDAGATFAEPIGVDGGNPAGRVDLVMDGDGSALVSWIERTGGEAAELRILRVSPEGPQGDPVAVASGSSARATGFPRMVSAPGGGVWMAWTDVLEEEPRIRVSRVEVPTP